MAFLIRHSLIDRLPAAITFKTFATDVFIPKIKKLTNIDIGAHIGIDQETVLVRKIGLKRYNGRTDRQNEVWAGKPVNMAAKLAGLTAINELLVSDRFLDSNIKDERATMSCGCPNNNKVCLWQEKCLNDTKFDFTKAYLLTSKWCQKHGQEFCNKLLELDNNKKAVKPFNLKEHLENENYKKNISTRIQAIMNYCF